MVRNGHRMAMLDRARRIVHSCAIVDSDEILTGTWYRGSRLHRLDERRRLLMLPWICLAQEKSMASVESHSIHFRVWGTNWVTCAFHDIPSYCWQARDGYDFTTAPDDIESVQRSEAATHEQGGLMHLQFSNRRPESKAGRCINHRGIAGQVARR